VVEGHDQNRPPVRICSQAEYHVVTDPRGGRSCQGFPACRPREARRPPTVSNCPAVYTPKPLLPRDGAAQGTTQLFTAGVGGQACTTPTKQPDSGMIRRRLLDQAITVCLVGQASSGAGAAEYASDIGEGVLALVTRE